MTRHASASYPPSRGGGWTPGPWPQGAGNWGEPIRTSMGWAGVLWGAGAGPLWWCWGGGLPRAGSSSSQCAALVGPRCLRVPRPYRSTVPPRNPSRARWLLWAPCPASPSHSPASDMGCQGQAHKGRWFAPRFLRWEDAAALGHVSPGQAPRWDDDTEGTVLGARCGALRTGEERGIPVSQGSGVDLPSPRFSTGSGLRPGRRWLRGVRLWEGDAAGDGPVVLPRGRVGASPGVLLVAVLPLRFRLALMQPLPPGLELDKLFGRRKLQQGLGNPMGWGCPGQLCWSELPRDSQTPRGLRCLLQWMYTDLPMGLVGANWGAWGGFCCPSHP